MKTKSAMKWLFCIVFLLPWITPETKAKEPESTVTVETDDLNVRSGPGMHHDIVTTLAKGKKYPFIQREKDWIQIQLPDEKKGWVADFLVTVNPADDGSEKKFTHTTLSILHNGTNIRQSPSTQAMIVERSNEGDTYEAVQLKDSWYQIKLSNGESGYVASWIVSEISADSRTKKEQQDSRVSLKNKTIVIDPGHGGEDGGTVGKYGTLEKRLTLETAKQLSRKLEEAGANVILTRNGDLYLPLTSRVETGYYRNADAFISIHYDNSKDKSVRGLTTYFYHSWQKELAVELHSAAVDQTKQENRGVRFGDYYVIRENNKKAVLIELGYLSNPAEELLVRSDEYQKSAATGIYEGLGRYFNE
ncbi:N-acetylmuramoyl-L-alanine amidase [Bacillus benzoevorans]|uniref:N-acetylmuramoyl-L-alanine amidase n=1 Tax=Bacillus benzoevorans TaxID=1456 RepID=A0A7X0HSC2_9BACI|nr:N-acetylmuramoyl-L-alanine amidase [Bacillus benzoevorans]MBB6445913.1 N-acetylmuramoyl-L-alanine amidase [Bacillus benzoevorans]